MLKQKVGLVALAACVALGVTPVATRAAEPSLKGRILLDVQRRGEAWYVDPISGERVFLASGATVGDLMPQVGLGISNADLEKIPVGFTPIVRTEKWGEDPLDQIQWDLANCDAPTEGEEVLCVSGTIRKFMETDKHIQLIKSFVGGLNSAFSDIDEDRVSTEDEINFGTNLDNNDTDGDGYYDGDEIQNGYSPLGPGRMMADAALVNRLKGRILLQVEKRGEAWYVNPVDGRRYYLSPQNARQALGALGAGIPSATLDTIPMEAESALLYSGLQKPNICEGITCLITAVESRTNKQSVIEVQVNEIRDIEADVNAKARILATYVAGKRKDYINFELLQLLGDPIKGHEVVDQLVASEFLPEGMTTEQKAVLAKDIEVIYEYVLAAVTRIMPRANCVVHDRAKFIEELKMAEFAIAQIESGALGEEELTALEEQVEAMQEAHKGSTTCSIQGGIMSL